MRNWIAAGLLVLVGCSNDQFGGDDAGGDGSANDSTTASDAPTPDGGADGGGASDGSPGGAADCAPPISSVSTCDSCTPSNPCCVSTNLSCTGSCSGVSLVCRTPAGCINVLDSGQPICCLQLTAGTIITKACPWTIANAQGSSSCVKQCDQTNQARLCLVDGECGVNGHCAVTTFQGVNFTVGVCE